MKQKRNKWDPKAKQRKQRRLVIILGVVFAAIAAWQGPKTWKSMHAHPPVDAVAPPALTAPLGVAGGTVATGGSLASTSTAVPPATERVPVAGAGQLVGFSLFKSKDPFAPQLDDSAADPGTTTTASPPAFSPPAASPPASSPPASTPPASEPPAVTPPASEPPAAEPPAPEPPVVVPPASEPPSTEPPATVPPTSEPPPSEPPTTEPPVTSPPATPPAPPAAKPTSATISVNGVKEDVSIGGVFPKDEQLFRLVSIADDVAQIAIAGGSYQDGEPTVPLTLGKPLTLMNTADGTRYVLRLLAVA